MAQPWVAARLPSYLPQPDIVKCASIRLILRGEGCMILSTV
jgi:hypothetical protein